MSGEAQQVIPTAIDYRPVKTVTPIYRWRQVVPQVAPTSPVPTSQTDVVFIIPGGSVMNLGKSRFTLGYQIAATGAANSKNFLHSAPPIYRVTLTTAHNQTLVDISNYRVYQKAVIPAVVTKDEFKAMSTVAYGITAGANAPFALAKFGPWISSAVGPPVQDASALSGLLKVPGAGPLVPGMYAAYMPSAAVNSTSYPGTFICDTVIDAPQLFVGSDAANIAGGDAYTWDCQLQHLFPHTVLQTLQDLYFGEDLMLKLTLHGLNEIGFKATNATTFAGAAAFAANAVTVTQNSCNLWIAVQQNEEIAKNVQSQVQTSGMQLGMQQVVTFQNANQLLANAQSYSQINALTSGYGRAVLRCYTVATQDDSLTYAANAFNIQYPVLQAAPLAIPAGQCDKWDTYQSFVNQTPTSDYPLSTRDVYDRQFDLLKNTCLSNQQTWQAVSSVVIEDWSGLPSGEALRMVTPEGGLSLLSQINHQINLNRLSSIGTKSTVWQFYIMARILRLSREGAMVL